MNNFINDEHDMNESSFDAVMKKYQEVHMDPAEKREVFMQTMLVIEKLEAVSLAHGDLNKAMRPTSVPADKGFGRGASAWFSYIKRREFVPALLTAIVFLFTGGASVLAEQSLPGDSLYAIKVNVNEPIREFTTVGGEAKAKLAIETTERRLQEATVLSAQGKLDESNKQILQAQFTRNASQVHNQVASLVSANNLDAAEEVLNTFGNTLSAHSLILGTLAGESVDGDASSTPNGPNTVAATGDASSTAPGVVTIDPATAVTVSLDNAAGLGFAPLTTIDVIGSASTGTASPTPTSTPMSNSAGTPTTTPAANANAQNSATPTAAVAPSTVNSLLQAVRAEIDSTKNVRIGIEAQTNATIAKSTTVENSANSKVVIESMIQGIKFNIDDIRSELDAHKFDPKAFVYAPNTIAFAKQRMDDASSTIEQMNVLIKSESYAEAIKKGRAASRNLSEVLVVLKIEKTTKGSLDGKVNLTSLIQSNAANIDAANGTTVAPAK